MKTQVAVVVIAALVLLAFAVPASASVRDYVAPQPARHQYGWAKLAPVDQAELQASRLAPAGSARLMVPAEPRPRAPKASRGELRSVSGRGPLAL